MDGVLIESEYLMRASAIRALADYGVTAQHEDFLEFTGMGEDRFVGGVAEKHGLAYKTEMKELKNLQQEYYNKYGKSPKVSYLASRMGVSAEHVMEVLEAIDSLSNVESLDNTLIPEGMHGGDYVDEEETNVDIMDLKEAIRELEDRERQIIVLRYFKDMTQQQPHGSCPFRLR